MNVMSAYRPPSTPTDVFMNHMLEIIAQFQHVPTCIVGDFNEDVSISSNTGGSCLSWIFWEHENQSGLLVIWLIYIKLYRKNETKFWKKKSGLSGNLA